MWKYLWKCVMVNDAMKALDILISSQWHVCEHIGVGDDDDAVLTKYSQNNTHCHQSKIKIFYCNASLIVDLYFSTVLNDCKTFSHAKDSPAANAAAHQAKQPCGAGTLFDLRLCGCNHAYNVDKLICRSSNVG